jgi:hypothetical protein
MPNMNIELNSRKCSECIYWLPDTGEGHCFCRLTETFIPLDSELIRPACSMFFDSIIAFDLIEQSRQGAMK